MLLISCYFVVIYLWWFLNGFCRYSIMGVEYKKGDQVNLFIDKLKVGVGTVMKIDAEDTVQSILLGRDRVGVLVESLRDRIIQLPFPTTRLLNVFDAIDSCVIWESSSTSLVVSVPTLIVGGSSNRSGTGSLDVHSMDAGCQSSTSNSIKNGDFVIMYLLGEMVARGRIQSTLATYFCHNKLIGFGRVSVHVMEVDDNACPLVYPNAGADNLGKALGMVVIWDLADVKISPFSLPGIRRETGSSRESAFHPSPEIERLSIPPVSSGTPDSATLNVVCGDVVVVGKDFSIRRNWMFAEVSLFSVDREAKLGEGIITIASPGGVVNDELLGDDFVGVVICDAICKSHFPTYCDGVALLVKWSIFTLRLKCNGRFLGDILREAAEELADEEDRDALDLGLDDYNLPEKRPYNHIKRKKHDPEEKRRKLLESRAHLKTDEESIDALGRISCCLLKCCKSIPPKDVKGRRITKPLISSIYSF